MFDTEIEYLRSEGFSVVVFNPNKSYYVMQDRNFITITLETAEDGNKTFQFSLGVNTWGTLEYLKLSVEHLSTKAYDLAYDRMYEAFLHLRKIIE